MFRPYVFASLASLAALAGAGAASADIYLRTPLTPGDVIRPGFEGQIALTGVSMNVSSLSLPDPEGIAPAIRSTSVSPLYLTKSPDRATARLMAAAIDGTPLGRIEISFTTPQRGGGETVESRWILEGAEVRSVSLNTDVASGGGVIENVEIVYASMTYQYFTRDARGQRSGGMEETSWRAPEEDMFSFETGCH